VSEEPRLPYEKPTVTELRIEDLPAEKRAVVEELRKGNGPQISAAIEEEKTVTQAKSPLDPNDKKLLQSILNALAAGGNRAAFSKHLSQNVQSYLRSMGEDPATVAAWEACVTAAEQWRESALDRKELKRQERFERVRKQRKDEAREAEVELPSARASQIDRSRQETLFGGRLIRRCYVPIAGEGEVGKGMVSCYVIAILTTGEPFPGETTRRDPMTVLVCVTEDAEGVVTDRIEAAGGDLDRVVFVRGQTVLRGGLEMPSAVAMDDDAGALVKKAQKEHASALFLETTLSHLGDREGKRRVETNNEASVRRAHDPITASLRAANLYGWGLMHPRKSVEGVVEDAISGSAAFRNMFRMVLHVFKDPRDDSERLLPSTKANYMVKRPPTLRFRIDPWERDPLIGHVVWGVAEQSKLIDPRTCDDIWREIQEKRKKLGPRKDVRVAGAEAFLKALLAEERLVDLDEIKKIAEQEELSWISIVRAKANLGVESVRASEFPAPVLGWRLNREDM